MTAEPQGLVAWAQLVRITKHRTSAPTDAALRRAIGDIAKRRGARPNADAVLLAALRLADPAALAVEVRKIENQRHRLVTVVDGDDEE